MKDLTKFGGSKGSTKGGEIFLDFAVSSSMDPPATGGELNPGKLEEAKEAGPLYHCGLYDTDIVHKIAQALLLGLAAACVDNTTGAIFKTPASVAVDVRKEMVDYLTQRSETFLAEFTLSENAPVVDVSQHPYDIISDLIDDFSSSKRNMFGRVSGWLMSETREDKIDDFVQDMETNGFWLIGRREAIAQTLVKNVDFKNFFHCDMKFDSKEDLAEHTPNCSFRTINCISMGCNARFCAANMKNHDSICPFKMLPCEQKCSDRVMRREMDRHCITVCPMKLVNCSFYPVGCQATIPRCSVEEHNLENLHSHMHNVLRTIHKKPSVADLKSRVEQLEKLSSPGQLAEAQDVRSLTIRIKGLEAKLGPLEVEAMSKVRECAEIPVTEEVSRESSLDREEYVKSVESPSKRQDHVETPN